MSSHDLDLVVAGDCNPDVVLTGPDLAAEFDQHERLADAGALVIGGSAAITAVAAARLGLRVALAAVVGADPAAELMLALLAREGVDTTAVTVRPGRPTALTVVLSRGQDRAILTAPGALATLTAAEIPVALLARARWLHVSSYFLLERSLGPGLAGLLTTARSQGLRTSLDTNFDPSGRWGDQRLSDALACADVFLPNAAEAIGISGQADAETAARALRGSARSVVVKLGDRGALCAPSGGPEMFRVCMPPVTPVDTTGAGDCFNAGLIAGLLRGNDLAAAVALGCAVGAASTAGVGGTAACPDLDQAVAAARSAIVSQVCEMSQPQSATPTGATRRSPGHPTRP